MKDEKIIYYRIKITRIRGVKGSKYSKSFTDKMWCVECRDRVGACKYFRQPTLKKLFKQLKDELYV